MEPGQPWQVLPALPAWQVIQLPRPFSHHDDGNPGGGLPDDGTAQRAQELVSAYCRSAPPRSPSPGSGSMLAARCG
jgi:hypothetical protein